MAGSTAGAGTAYRSVAPEFTLFFYGVRVAHFLVFGEWFCRS